MGQAKKRRLCPVAGREISAAECGDGRHGRYACPESCPFNPFAGANYSALLETEGRLDQESVRHLDGETPGGVWQSLDAAHARNPGHGMHAASVWHLFFARDPAGRTFADRWEQAGFPGLKNDERVLFRAKMQTRVALLEIHRVLDAERIEAIDLLDPGSRSLVLIDRAVAARAVRFSAILTWIYPLPHFWRLTGTGLMVQDIGSRSPDEIILACVSHLGGSALVGPDRGRWLAENFVRVDAALTATGRERRRRMLSGLDAQFGAATYSLTAPLAECRAVLAADPSTADDDLQDDERKEGFTAAMAWFDDAPGEGAGAGIPGRRVRGRIILAADRLRVEAVGGAKLDDLRARCEAALGARVIFSKERRVDHGAQMAAKEPVADVNLVPPGLLEQPMQLDLASSRVPPPPPGVSLADYSAALKNEQRRTLPDLRLPALDGHTPREAAADPALRPKLVSLMKIQVRALDEENLRSGRCDDLNTVLRELGLGEIDFPPPPVRAKPQEEDEFVDDPEDGADEDFDGTPRVQRAAADGTRRSAPPLDGGPLSTEQAFERLDDAMQFSTARAALDEIASSGATVVEDLSMLTEPWLDDYEFSVFTPTIIQAWFALVPRGVRAPALRTESMAAAMSAGFDWLETREELSPTAVERFLNGCRQPALLRALFAGLVQGVEALPKKQRPSPDAVVGMLVMLRVLLDELDFARRR